MVEYLVADVGSPCDSISLRTLVETLKHQEVAVVDAITGQVYQLAMWEEANVERKRGLRGLQGDGNTVTEPAPSISGAERFE